ncbi:MAG TPA: polyribonucleotide nucleotidyltransferase [bacterium]|nr:polyribonucleotide nucleotidyltransferase [bacterium]
MKTHHVESIVFEGTPLSLETGKYAKQADGAVWCRYGNSVLLATAVAAKGDVAAEQDFFPLTVDYIEKFYAAGRFPGGFLKRESQPNTDEKLAARIIDRPIRPLFPDWYRSETQLLVNLFSHDENCDPRVIAITAASAALMISDVPFLGPIGGVRVVLKDGEYFINPTPQAQEGARLNIIMAANRDSILMVEGEAREATEDEIAEALARGHRATLPLIEMQEALMAKVAPVKRQDPQNPDDAALRNFIELFAVDKLKEALAIREKLARYEAIKEVKTSVGERVAESLAGGAQFLNADEPEKVQNRAKAIFEDVLKKTMRRMITEEGRRIDGRGPTNIRPIWIETGVLPQVHGSAIFTRGETQSLGTITLGVGSDEQRVDTVLEETRKTFMLHYNFPPFSVGEVGRLRAPGRREIGHGNLAERALKSFVPPKEEFAYTVRVVSEILESNGSSSMASVCSGCLALMDAGVPFKKHVAGIAMGLIKEGDDYAILSDIMGDEDHLGDMDFKVAGTKDGITAIQMDIKIHGLPQEVMRRALAQARDGRIHIIGEMEKALPEHRAELSPLAPKLVTIHINPERIRDLIGTGGKNIKSIVEKTGAEIEVQQDGSVLIAAKDGAVLDAAIAMVKSFTDEPEKGKTYEGVVTRIEDYGAFVEVMPGQTGLLHVSRIADKRIESVSDVLKLGDTVRVIVVELEGAGKFKLSMKPSDFERDFTKDDGEEPRRERRDRKPHGDRDRDRGRDRDRDRKPHGDRKDRS